MYGAFFTKRYGYVRFVKARLDDYSDLQRERRHCPTSALDVWMLNKRLRKENIFFEPLMTGECVSSLNSFTTIACFSVKEFFSYSMVGAYIYAGLCADLCNIYKRDFISAQPHLVSTEEPCPEHAQPPPTCDPMQNPDMEIEHPRNNEGRFDNNVLPDPTFMPSQTGYMSPLPRREEFTPISADSLGLETEPQWGTSIGTRVQPTPDLAASIETLGPEMETPMTFFEERQGLDDTGLSDIPEVMNSAEADVSLSRLFCFLVFSFPVHHVDIRVHIVSGTRVCFDDSPCSFLGLIIILEIVISILF